MPGSSASCARQSAMSVPQAVQNSKTIIARNVLPNVKSAPMPAGPCKSAALRGGFLLAFFQIDRWIYCNLPGLFSEDFASVRPICEKGNIRIRIG